MPLGSQHHLLVRLEAALREKAGAGGRDTKVALSQTLSDYLNWYLTPLGLDLRFDKGVGIDELNINTPDFAFEARLVEADRFGVAPELGTCAMVEVRLKKPENVLRRVISFPVRADMVRCAVKNGPGESAPVADLFLEVSEWVTEEDSKSMALSRYNGIVARAFKKFRLTPAWQ
jgi:hypothetical protein